MTGKVSHRFDAFSFPVPSCARCLDKAAPYLVMLTLLEKPLLPAASPAFGLQVVHATRELARVQAKGRRRRAAACRKDQPQEQPRKRLLI